MNQNTSTSDWATRPMFRENQRLTPERLNRILENQSQRLRMALLGVAGHGVVYGFQIGEGTGSPTAGSNGKLYVGCGLAIDGYGRQLYWPGGELEIGKEWMCGEKPTKSGCYLLKIHYAEHDGHDSNHCDANGDPSDWVKEGVLFSLKEQGDSCKKCSIACPPKGHGKGDCEDVCEYACGHTQSDPCMQNLCNAPPRLCQSAGETGWRYDANNAEPLACVMIGDLTEGSQQKCPPLLGFRPSRTDICHNRRYVFRNPLLQELLMGYHRDFPVVKSLSWQRGKDDASQTAPVAWHEFSQHVCSEDGFSIEFSKPIQIATLTPLSVILTIFIHEQRSDYWEGRRIPIEIIHHPEAANDKYTRKISLSFRAEWITAEITGSRSTLVDGSIVELTIRGAMLRDACHNMLDAKPLGYGGNDYRQERLGGDFVSAFSVEPHTRVVAQQAIEPKKLTNSRKAIR